MQKVLITGHTGMLGQNIVNTFSKAGQLKIFGAARTKLNISGITEFSLDLRDERAVRELTDEVKPDTIVHTAALTNLVYCEENKLEAQQMHVNLTKVLAASGARLVYISTDSVFDGTQALNTEASPTYPLNYYAQSKLQGEWAASCGNKNTLVLRTNIYGFKKPAGSSLAEWALSSLKEGKTISGYDDVFFNPLYVGQLSLIIRDCMHLNVTGTLHVGTHENISKFEFVTMLANEFGFGEAAIKRAFAPADGSLRRPKNTTLSIQRMKSILNQAPSLHAGLKMFKSDYVQHYEIN